MTTDLATMGTAARLWVYVQEARWHDRTFTLRTGEAAKLLGVTRRVIRKWAAELISLGFLEVVSSDRYGVRTVRVTRGMTEAKKAELRGEKAVPPPAKEGGTHVPPPAKEGGTHVPPSFSSSNTTTATNSSPDTVCGEEAVVHDLMDPLERARLEARQWIKTERTWVPADAWVEVEDLTAYTLPDERRREILGWVATHECHRCLSEAIKITAPENNREPVRNWMTYFRAVWASLSSACRRRQSQPRFDRMTMHQMERARRAMGERP